MVGALCGRRKSLYAGDMDSLLKYVFALARQWANLLARLQVPRLAVSNPITMLVVLDGVAHDGPPVDSVSAGKTKRCPIGEVDESLLDNALELRGLEFRAEGGR